ncbi:MAG: hypothetical protein LAT67_12415 [Balneolales bacterium]|nr:hypothetical protein [Balneolales bacterium]
MNHIIELNEIPQKDEYSRVLEYFDQTKVHESVLLKTYHDPKSLYFRFVFERTGQFSWDKTKTEDGCFHISILRIALACIIHK